MQNILFVLLPFPSHYFACFPYAKILQKKGNRIIFLGSIPLKTLVERQGFSFAEMKYTTEYSISSLSVFFALLVRSFLDKTSLYKRYKEWYEGIQMLVQRLQSNRPQKVYIDDHLWHYYPVIHNICKNIEIINTKLSTKKSANIPPLDSSFIPKSNFLSHVVCEALWLKHLMQLRFRESLIKIALLNRDEDYFTVRLAKQSGLDLSKLIDHQNSFYRGLRDVKVLILAPSSFEFPNKSLRPYEDYIDVPVDRNEEHLYSEDYREFVRKSKVLKAEGKKIIYCSFGTLDVLNGKKIVEFAQKLFSVLENEPQWQLIFSTRGIEFEKTPANVLLFNSVPQLDVLRTCDLMITHGGLTSIKECIQQNVPMLVYPLNSYVDQNGNAARVCFHKLGLRGNIRKETIKGLRNKIEILLTELPFLARS